MSFHSPIKEYAKNYYTYRTRLNLVYSTGWGTDAQKILAYNWCFNLKPDLGVFHPIKVFYHLASYTGTWNTSGDIQPRLVYRNKSIPISSNFVSPYVISQIASMGFNQGTLYCGDEDEDNTLLFNQMIIPEGSEIWIRNSSQQSRLADTVMVDIIMRGFHIKL